MSSQDDDSENDQGFIANDIKIDRQTPLLSQKQINRPKQFQAHYISGEGIIRKEPPQAIMPFNNIPSQPRSYPSSNILNINGGPLPTVKQLYGNNKLYYLIYKRFRDPFGTEEQQSFQNQVDLNCCQNYNTINFRPLKEWDQNCLDGEPINQTCLLLDSHFEGGNLLSAFRAKKQLNTYILFMQNDTNTYGYNQWFYFSVRNMKANIKYTFRIANFKKSYSFFSNGLQPLCFSLDKARETGNGWYRDGSHIQYYQSDFVESGCQKYYTLEFSVQFNQDQDYVTISPYAPYSYTRLITSLKRIGKVAVKNGLTWKLKSISDTISFNQVPYLTLSNRKEKKIRKKVVILARQHPGQTWSSFLAQQVISCLAEQMSVESQWLLQQFDFHIFPMVNVDGVIYGNFRCDLTGTDLNRTWKNPSQQIHPQIYHIKRQIQKLHQKYGVQMCIDMHTHSKEYGAFAYCCMDSQQGRQLPQIISNCSPFFRYQACTFGIIGEKKFTARAAIFGITSCINTLTIQLSAYGFKLYKSRYAFHYSPIHIRNMAKAILKGLHACKKNTEPQIQDQAIQIVDGEGEEGIKTVTTKEMLTCMKQNTQVQVPVEGSDSQPEIDDIEIQVKMKTIFPPHIVSEITAIKERKSSRKKVIGRVKKGQRSMNRPRIDYKIESKKSDVLSSKEELRATNIPQVEAVVVQQRQESSSSILKIRKPVVGMPNLSQTKKNSVHTSQKVPKLFIQKPTRPLNLIQFSLKKLPISVPDRSIQEYKNQPNFRFLLQDHEPLISNNNYTKKDDNRFDKTFSTYEAMCRPRVRVPSKKHGMIKEDVRVEQQLPFLCVMSQNKKQLQMQKMRVRDRQEQRSPDRKLQTKHHHLSTLNNHRNHHYAINKAKNKQKQLQILGKVGYDNFTRYAESTFLRKD